MHPGGLRFDRAVPSGGYAWWYIDGLSDDGQHGLTLIGFVGSVFSPYYAWARRRGAADPLCHCAFNIALYGPRAARWAMTERGAGRVQRESSMLSIGPSAMRFTGDALEVTVDEICAPIPRRLRGIIRLIPEAIAGRSFELDAAGRHRWTPFAPCSRVEVHLSEPALKWSGVGYLDSNSGSEPLENGFQDWTWSRANLPGGTVVLYDTQSRHGNPRALALKFTSNGAVQELEIPPAAALPITGWRVSRRTRADAGYGARVVKTLEDAPFYSRSLLQTRLLGATAPAIHESLNLDRFKSRWVQCLLPFRMPRVAR